MLHEHFLSAIRFIREIREHYEYALHFPGGHTPTADEVCNCYVPVIEQFLLSSQSRLSKGCEGGCCANIS